MTDPFVQSPFCDEVMSAFADLLRQGSLTVSSSAFDEKAFGNAAVVFSAHSFQLRVVRDRGEVLADVRALTMPEWRPLERMLRAVGVVAVPPEGLLSVAQAASLVGTHVAALEAGFSPAQLDETMRALGRLDADAARQFKERLRIPKDKA